MKLRGDPVSANQFSMFLFLSVVCMIISPGYAVYLRVFDVFEISFNKIDCAPVFLLFRYVHCGFWICCLEFVFSSIGGSIVWVLCSFIFWL